MTEGELRLPDILWCFAATQFALIIRDEPNHAEFDFTLTTMNDG